MNFGDKPRWLTKPPLLTTVDKLICGYWLPAGFFIFLVAFFLAANPHHYKIIVTDFLLLPALLATLAPSSWLRTLRQNPVFILVIAYLLYMAINAFFRRAEDKAEYLHWTAYILLFLIAVGRRMRITAQQLQYLLIASTLVAAGAGCFAVLHDLHSGIFHQAEYRLVGYGALYNPLLSGDLFGAFALIAAWGALSAPSRLMHWLAFSAAAICFVAVLLTGSRSPLIALLVAGLCATLFEKNHRRRLLWGVSICIISAAIVIFFWKELSARGTSLRPEIWLYVWRLCLQHFWLGVGLDAPLTIPTSIDATFFDDTHNVFLAALFYGGVFGLFLFVATFAASGLLAWRIRRQSTLATLASMLQLYGLVALQFDGSFLISRPNEFWVLYWLPIALYLRAACDQADKRIAIKKQDSLRMDYKHQPEVLSASYFTYSRPEMLGFIPSSAHTVLDVGCGCGGFGAIMQAKPGTEVWGVELDTEAASAASKVLHKVICGPVQAHMADLPDHYFDCICLNDVVEHLVDPWEVLRKLQCKLAPHGVIVASIPNVRHYKNLWQLLVNGNWNYTDAGVLDRTHLRFFTPLSMRQLFIDCGYHVTAMQGLRGSKKFKVKLWRYISFGKLWDIIYPQFAMVATISN